LRRTGARAARRVAAGLILPLTIAAAPAEHRAGGPPLRLLPAATPAGERVVTSGAVVATAMLGRPDAAILVGPVAVAQGSERRTLARGTVLAATKVAGLPGDIDQVFCERPEGQPATGQMLFGLDPLAPPATPDMRFCLIDADEDSFFDHALLLGPKGAGKPPAAIPKVEFGLIPGAPIGGDALVRLRYVGASEDRKSVAFDLEVFGYGRMRTMAGARHDVSIVRLPAQATIAGAVVTVLSYDAKADAATIIINRDLAPGHIVLPEMGK
jgi:hypothetical protein